MRLHRPLLGYGLGLALLLGGATGCGIDEEVHKKTLNQLEETQTQLADQQKVNENKDKEIAQLKTQVSNLEKKIADLEKIRDQLKADLEATRGELKLYESKTGGLEKALQATKAELVELRKARAAAEKRLAEYRKLTEKLAGMVKAGTLSVTVRNGKMVLQLSDKILFDPGRKGLKKDGKTALKEVASVLKQFRKRQFLVTGHTDNVPTSGKRFKSNWELSTARAVEVVKFLQEEGVKPDQLAAAGYSEYDPVAKNSTKKNRALNRRIEIVLMPNLEELPQLPDDILEPDS